MRKTQPIRTLWASAASAILVATLATASALTLSTLAAEPAHAHDQLVSTTPGDGESVTAAPEVVTMTFSDNLLEVGSLLRVTDSSGKDWVSGSLSVSDTVVTQPLLPDAPNGVYNVAWRVVSSDGHPISGSFAYSVGSGDADSPNQPTSSSSADPSAAPQTAPSAVTDDESVPDQQDVQDAMPSAIRTLVIALIGAAAAIGLCVLIVRIVRRSQRPAASDALETDDTDERGEQTPPGASN